MFKTEASQVFEARAARIAFGAMLTTGALILVHRLTRVVDGEARAWLVMLVSWFAALAAGAVARRIVRDRFHGPSRDPESWLLASLVLPGIGMSLMLPLLLHLPFAVLLGGARGFDSWGRLGVMLVGWTHLALAALVTARAFGLVRGTGYTPSTHQIWLITVIVACIPGIFLFGIPPLLVGITGLAFVPILQHMQVLVDSERAAAPHVPCAIALVERRA